MEKDLIRLQDVSKFYYSKGVIASGFSKVNLTFNIGEFVAITGESGSGKSTLLNVISGLDTYEEGELFINGEETSHYTEKDFENYRRKNIANIYQSFNLINSYTVFQNIEMVLMLNGTERSELKKKIDLLLKKVDLYDFKNTKISKLSGGQKQRVAIARALAKETPVIIADEPTGNLDTASAAEIIGLLREVAKERLVIIVTHNYEQVEEYVTRKIKMHDGQVLEDKTLKGIYSTAKLPESSETGISFGNKIRLSIRNTFNIIPKFILLLIVFLFVTVAVMSEYASFEKDIYLNSSDGYSYVFTDTSENRIVITKEDGSSITDDDFKAIESLGNIESIEENDLILDNYIEFADEDGDFWLDGTTSNISDFSGDVDLGSMPENDNEIVVVGSSDDYYLGYMGEDLIGTTVYLADYYTSELDYSKEYTIVGISYDDSNSSDYGECLFYVSDTVAETINESIDQVYNTVTSLFNGSYFLSSSDDPLYKITANDNVPEGCAYVCSDFNSYVSSGSCIDLPLTVNISNIYYEDSLDLTITNTYTSTTMESLLGISYSEDDYGNIYINTDDYNELFNGSTYQSSVFVSDMDQLDETVSELQDLGYNTLVIKDTLVDSGFTQILNMMQTFVTAALFIVLFFIAYFVIRLIMKSRNIYFSTIRMLGANKGCTRFLLIVELMIIASIAYGAFLIFIYCANIGLVSFSFTETMIEYLKLKDYCILYLVFLLMSILIGNKYANKLFKGSAITVYNSKEV